MNKCVYPARLLLSMMWSYNLIQPMEQVVRLSWIPTLLMKAANSLCDTLLDYNVKLHVASYIVVSLLYRGIISMYTVFI